MFEKLCDNLNDLMSETHISADELARRTLVPSSTIKKIRNRYNPNPTLNTLLPLANYFSVTLDQLVGNQPLPDKRIRGLYQISHVLQHLPVLNWNEVVSWPTCLPETSSTITSEFAYGENAFALTINEDSCSHLPKDTVILIDPTVKPQHRDFIIVHRENQKIPTLKQLLIDDEQSYLKPLVSGYSIVTLTPDYKILGVIIEFKRHLRIFPDTTGI